MSKKRNNARYILNKKCTNMHENEDADQLCGNSVTSLVHPDISRGFDENRLSKRESIKLEVVRTVNRLVSYEATVLLISVFDPVFSTVENR